MSSRIRLLALDMDGTTLNETNQISAENQKWIQKAMDAGIMVMFATGRPLQEIVSYREQLDLHSPMVLLNGSEVRDADGVCIERHFLNPEDVEKLHQLAMSYQTWFWGYTSEGPVKREKWQEAFLSRHWMKFGLRSDDHQVIQEVMSTIKSWGNLKVTSSNWNNVEVNPMGVSKASGVRKVCERYTMSMSEVMAIGDSLNDYPLFEEVGLSVAMDNAHEELKQIADKKTASNTEDGVAKAIEQFLLD
ncbi:5-amino-6-(5-phospho-D-ribitylamino)uracil phosphatase YcsE [Pullulanibacillus camelliae]|uniref:5-amino-6-(5-phospho-D-ribitylamino)uracil phosphatase YcsE n=1 Tax=Pullulanibacillus camelliae TaxID=1707096 RepID=A0A8J2YB64_9BACL|nr:Cof-type HAD-IIB family hydrolase [Pullulanibacillus camelliae]GGE26906.1 5-amino-6-(5-phospho-D-ribitylamino)uracil phosphatase YcsE [Pullulanibacillus camelliae]